VLFTLRRAAPAAVLSLSLLGAACSSGGSTSTDAANAPGGSSAPSSGMDYSTLKGDLNGSGSSFQAGFIDACREGLQEEAPDLTVNYGAVGSGTGKSDLADQKTQFAGTDSLVKEDEKAKYKGGALFYFPTVAAPITVSYNVSGVSKLQLSPVTVAKIFQGEVKTWNAEEIKADNPGASLPATDIKVVRRADSSGTTETFTKYLKKAAPDAWKLEAASTVTWPADFVSAPQNGGVAQAIKGSDGSVGYVDFNDAKSSGLSLASIKNKAGTYIEPSLSATEAALGAATVKPDLTYDALDTAAPSAYPIVAATYILTYQKYGDATTVTNLKGWLTYVLHEGQGLAEGVNYAKLPASLLTPAQDQVAKITAG
jgi:phosphate transport system substrate-binding protein